MKLLLSCTFTTCLMVASQISLAATEKIVRSDRISYMPSSAVKASSIQHIARTDRIKFYQQDIPNMVIQPTTVSRTDRIVFYRL